MRSAECARGQRSTVVTSTISHGGFANRWVCHCCTGGQRNGTRWSRFFNARFSPEQQCEANDTYPCTELRASKCRQRGLTSRVDAVGLRRFSQEMFNHGKEPIQRMVCGGVGGTFKYLFTGSRDGTIKVDASLFLLLVRTRGSRECVSKSAQSHTLRVRQVVAEVNRCVRCSRD